MGRAARAGVVVAAVILVLAATISLAADRAPAGASGRARESARKRQTAAPQTHGARKGGEARLDTVNIVGSAEHPSILFFLPRAKFRLLPLRPDADPASLLLRDDKRSRETPGP